MAPQVMEVLKSTSTFRIQTYKDFLASKKLGPLSAANNCGITPTLEKLPFTSNGGADKKRHLSPDQSAIKRHKSVSDDTEVVKVEGKTKTFEEPAWE